jgi:hypothetical protein
MAIRHPLNGLCPGAPFCLSNTRVLVGKPFQYQAPVASLLFTTMTIGTKIPTPPPILTVKHQKRKVLFDCIFCKLSQNQTPALPKQTVQRRRASKA